MYPGGNLDMRTWKAIAQEWDAHLGPTETLTETRLADDQGPHGQEIRITLACCGWS